MVKGYTSSRPGASDIRDEHLHLILNDLVFVMELAMYLM